MSKEVCAEECGHPLRMCVCACMPYCVGVCTCLLRVDSHGSVGVPRVLPQPVPHRLPFPRHLGVQKRD